MIHDIRRNELYPLWDCISIHQLLPRTHQRLPGTHQRFAATSSFSSKREFSTKRVCLLRNQKTQHEKESFEYHSYISSLDMSDIRALPTNRIFDWIHDQTGGSSLNSQFRVWVAMLFDRSHIHGGVKKKKNIICVCVCV